jgi:ketosteroid isomerase-like protein
LRRLTGRNTFAPAPHHLRAATLPEFAMRTPSLTTLAAIALLTACQPAPPPPPADESAAAADAIKAADAAWEKVFTSMDTTAALAAMEPTGSMLAPNAPIASGAEQVRAAVVGLWGLPGISLHWTAATAEASKSGDLGYTRGTYEMTVNDAKGKPMSDKGKYVTVWRKQGDGTWKVVTDIFNSDMAPAGH